MFYLRNSAVHFLSIVRASRGTVKCEEAVRFEPNCFSIFSSNVAPVVPLTIETDEPTNVLGSDVQSTCTIG